MDLGKPEYQEQRYFTEEQLKRIINAAEGSSRVLYALLAGTSTRVGEAAGLHVDDLDLDNFVIYVRRAVWNGGELAPKTRNAVCAIDIDQGLADLLRHHLGDRKGGRVFEARNGSPISGNNVLKLRLAPVTKPTRNPEGRASRFPALEGDDPPQTRHAGGSAKAVDRSLLVAHY